MRPRGVRAMNPSCKRKGSYTSSIVPASSPVAAAMVSRPTGRPQIAVSSFYGSVYPAVQNLLLGCRAVGLGASLQTLPIWWVPSVRKILGLPRNVTPVCLIPIGWAKGRYGPTERRPIGEVVHLDRYGNQPFIRR